ncbi:MAG: hypothetical protein J5486_04340 [Bacteroidaceae bacterium]|nr:hypothetical protein [Bacteroidaceae bacterium]
MIEDVKLFLEQAYDTAMLKASGRDAVTSNLQDERLCLYLETIYKKAETSKAVLAVTVTSLVYKIAHPEQDVRLHQKGMEGGYSGRTFDSKYITPFLRSHRFPSMEESGWLTRSFEQKRPYTLDYSGSIKGNGVKEAFLSVLHAIEEGGLDCSAALDFILQGLIIERDKKNIELAIPQNLTISNIINLLQQHFNHKYNATGQSRLPVLAVYAVYQLLCKELKRYEGKTLLPIESHTSADSQSGRKGDVDINNTDGSPFEAVEVKFDIPVSYNIVEIAKEKINTCHISRYYILSTKHIVEEDKEKVEETIRQIRNVHGCQLVVNGLIPTLKYYLRLIDNTGKFIENYTTLLAEDKTIKFEHKQMWNVIVSEFRP